MTNESTERREDERQAVRMTLWISGAGNTEYEPLSVSDVSLGGLAFRSGVEWASGSPVLIYVNVDRPMEMNAQVLRCTPRTKRLSRFTQALSGQLFDVAVAFQETDSDELSEFVGQVLRTEVYHRGLVA